MKALLFFITFFFILTSICADDKKAEDEKKIKALVKKLSDNDYQVREDATKKMILEFIEYKDLVEKHLKDADDLETTERLEFILQEWKTKSLSIANELASQAYALVDEKKYDEALIAIERSLKIKKFSSTSFKPFLTVNEHLGRYSQNAKFLKEMIVEYEKDDKFLMGIGLDLEDLYRHLINNLLAKKDFAEALEVSKTYVALSRFPNEALELQAYVLELGKKIKEAENLYTTLINKYPDDQRILHAFIDFSVRQNKIDPDLLKKYLGLLDLNNNPINYSCVYLFYDNQTDLAIKILENNFIKKFEQDLNEGTFSFDSMFSQNWYFLMFHIFISNQAQKPQNQNIVNCYKKISKEHQAEWPLPILGYYAGELTTEDLLKSANLGSPKEKREKLCEMHFYVALSHLMKNEKEKAQNHLKKCIDNDVLYFIEPTIAFYLLNKLK